MGTVPNISNFNNISNSSDVIDVILTTRFAMIYIYNNHTVKIHFRHHDGIYKSMIDISVLELIKTKISTDVQLGIDITHIKYKDQIQSLFSNQLKAVS